MTTMQERRTPQKPLDPITKPNDGDGPSKPDVRKPGGGSDELLKRLRKIDPEQAKRYRQRSGQ
jgi:hypothetical protein